MRILLYFVIFILFLPKINLIELSETSGLRIDDIFIFGIFGIFFLALLKQSKFKFIIVNIHAFKFILYLLILSIISLLLNAQITNLINIAYSIRLLEYSIFILIGYYFFQYKIDLEKIVLYYGIVSIVIIFFQYFEILGGFVLGEYSPSVQSRSIGLTAGPWEVALILVFFMITLHFKNNNNKSKLIYYSALISALSLTGSRIGLFSSIIILILLYKKNLLRFLFLSLPIIGVMILYSSNIPAIERSQALLKLDNLQTVTEIYQQVDISKTFENEYNKIDLSIVDKDVSWLIRATKWMYILKNNLSNPHSIFFGYSPGYYGSAVDGSYLRIFGELGIIGLILYFLLLKTLIINTKMKFIVYATFINMIFIDVIYSYKIMSFLFLFYGYYYAQYYSKETSS